MWWPSHKENPLWGAPRIHGELPMLGIEVAESTVARYMSRRQQPPSQGWKTFLRNHGAGIASIDLFVVRTISFKLLYGLVILRHARRRLVSISVTNNPTAESQPSALDQSRFPRTNASRHRLEQRRIGYPWHVLLAVEYGRSMKKLMVRNSLDVSLSSLSLLSGCAQNGQAQSKRSHLPH